MKVQLLFADRDPAVNLRLPARADDLVSYTEADQVFHLKLLSYADNPRLVDLVAELRGQTRLLGLAGLLEQGRLVDSAQEHHVIVELIRSRDAAAVERFMHQHLSKTRTTWAGRAAGG